MWDGGLGGDAVSSRFLRCTSIEFKWRLQSRWHLLFNAGGVLLANGDGIGWSARSGEPCARCCLRDSIERVGK